MIRTNIWQSFYSLNQVLRGLLFRALAIYHISVSCVSVFVLEKTNSSPPPTPLPHIVSQGWFSPGQVFVLDEYCARNGVRGCHRHLCYLGDLLGRADTGAMIDPTLLHYSFAFCASHVHGNRYTISRRGCTVSATKRSLIYVYVIVKFKIKEDYHTALDFS